MKRKRIFYQAYHALTKAYIDGTLMHGSKYASAMGCIIQQEKLRALKKELGEKEMMAALRSKKTIYQLDSSWHKQLKQFRRTPSVMRGAAKMGGYSLREADRIENAFSSYSGVKDRDGYLGMRAVLHVLEVIHGVESAKKVGK